MSVENIDSLAFAIRKIAKNIFMEKKFLIFLFFASDYALIFSHMLPRYSGLLIKNSNLKTNVKKWYPWQ